MTFSCPCGWRGNVTCPVHGGELNGYKAAYEQALRKNQAEYKDLYTRELEKENIRLRAALEAEIVLNDAKRPIQRFSWWDGFVVGASAAAVVICVAMNIWRLFQ